MKRLVFTFLMMAPNLLMTAPGNVKVGLHKMGDVFRHYGVALHSSAFYLFTSLSFYFSTGDGNGGNCG